MGRKSYRTSEIKVLNSIGLLTANFTAAVTDIITSNAHGLKDKDMVVLTTSGTLPAGLATGTVYYVKRIDANTFYLHTTSQLETVDRVDITDTGTGTHTFTMHDVGYTQDIEDYDTVTIIVATSGSCNATIKFLASEQDDEVDFSDSQAVDNEFDYVSVYDNQNNTDINGDTGVAFAGTDDVRHFELNVDGRKKFNTIITAWSAGAITVKIIGYKK